MANSTLNGPSGAQHHQRNHRTRKHTADVPAKPLTPPKTPGVQGSKDQADPNHTSILGWTPNLTGVRDWADHTLKEVDHLWHWALGGIGLEKDTGTPLAKGAAAPPAPAGQLAIDDAHMLTLKVTTVFEGNGGKSMDYIALSGNFDGMITSFGLVQWNFGTSSLERLLKKFQAADSGAFDRAFPADAKLDDLKAALAASDNKKQKDWAIDLRKTPAGKVAWKTAFENLGGIDKFKQIQVDDAINWYNPIVVKDIKYLRTLAPKLMATVEFRSYAAMFDCAIQQGGIRSVSAKIKEKVDSDKPATQFALMEIALGVRARAANDKWVADCLSRRMGILNGKALSFTEHGVTANRPNSQYGIVQTNATKIVAGL